MPRYNPLSILFVLLSVVPSATHAQVIVGNGGDEMRIGYQLAAKSMARKVSEIKSCSLPKGTSEGIKNWILANQAEFADDILQSIANHKWVEEDRPTCAYTYRQRNAETTYSFKRCLQTGNTRTKAEKIVVHESVHHLGIEDELFADQVAQAVFDSTYRLTCPGTQSQSEKVLLKSSLWHTCAIKKGNTYCWGDKSGLENLPANYFTNPRDLALTSTGTCVLDDVGVRCFHDGSATPTAITQVPAHSRVEAIFGGASFVCMVERTGNKCWAGGSNMHYMEKAVDSKLFTNTKWHGYVIDRDGLKSNAISGHDLYLRTKYINPRDISGAETHFCALDDRGIICGNESNRPIEGIDFPSHIAVGEQHGCAIDGPNVRCWGSNHYGQAPVVIDFSNPYAISAGNRFTCAADDEGVTCWGENKYTSVPSALR